MDKNQIASCGCRFAGDEGNTVDLCEACSLLPCHTWTEVGAVTNLPPRDENAHEYERKSSQPSVEALVVVEGFRGYTVGRYLYGLAEWQIEGHHGPRKVLEWWPLPERGTGVAV